MHAVQQNHRHPYNSNTTHFNVKDEGSSGSESASIDVVVRGGDEEHEDDEHYFVPLLNKNGQGAHVEANPSYRTPDSTLKDENPYYNPHYLTRTSSAADSAYVSPQINGHSHYPTANGTPIDPPLHPPHYYELHPQKTPSGVSLIPLALVDREVHSRRVSALILPQETTSKFSRNSQTIYQQGAARTGRRRFSATNSGGAGARKMAGEEVHYAQSQMFPPIAPQQKETLGRRAAQKFLQQRGAFRRAKASNGSKLAALGSELSQSASALYSLFTTSTKTAGSDDEEEFDRRSVLSDHLQFGVQHVQHVQHYQQPMFENKPEQIYAAANVQMSAKASVSMAVQAMEELTDKTEDISEHTQRGIDFLDRYANFANERAMIEDEYAKKVRNLIKKYSSKKKDNDEWQQFSYVTAFELILREVASLAAQHEVISDKLKKEICPTIIQKCQEFRASRKRHLQGLHALNNAYQAQIDNMQRHLKGYMKAFKDTESAHIKFFKADSNMDLSRAEVEKCRQNLQQKIYACEQAKQHYAAALETTNTAQRAHFNEKIPHLLDEMRRLDVDRIQETKQAMMQCVDVETEVLSVVKCCYNDMREAIRTIDPPKDTHIVVEQNKTGYAIPADFEFRDLGCPSKILEGNGESMVDTASNSTATLKRGQSATAAEKLPRKSSIHQKIFGGPSNSNGRSNGTSDYGNLPPQQRCRKIDAKLQELVKKLQTNDQSKAGLAKMFDVYTRDPKLGSASDVSNQMKQLDKEGGDLKQEIDRYRRLLLDTQKELNVPFSPISSLPQPPNGMTNGHASPKTLSATSLPANNRISYSEDSVSSDGSAIMGGPPKRINGHIPLHPSNTRIPHIDSSAEATSNSNSSHRNTSTASSGIAAGGDLYEDPDEHLPPLGTCEALYEYRGDSTGDSVTISMAIGERFELLEKDDGQGDGWTRVRNPRTGNEGFVPTSYIKCHWL